MSGTETTKVYYCTGCGSVLEFDIASQQFKCPNCGTQGEVQTASDSVREFDFNELLRSKDRAQWKTGQVEIIKCEGCGAEVVVGEKDTTATCAYCGSSHVMGTKQAAGIRPEGIVPFKIDKSKANEIFSKWIKSRFFAPNALKVVYQKDKMKAVYVPFWTYDAYAVSSFRAEGGEEYTVTVGSGKERHTETRVRWYPVSGRVDGRFDDVLVSAGERTQCSNFSTGGDVLPFSDAYLSGFMAEKYSLDPVVGFERAKNIMHNALEDKVRTQVLRRYDRCRNIRIHPQYSDVTFKQVLFPSWLVCYHYNQKDYQVTVNGQNGTVRGKYPVSPVKVGITAGVVLAIIVLLCILFSGAGDNDADYSPQNAAAVIYEKVDYNEDYGLSGFAFK